MSAGAEQAGARVMLYVRRSLDSETLHIVLPRADAAFVTLCGRTVKDDWLRSSATPSRAFKVCKWCRESDAIAQAASEAK